MKRHLAGLAAFLWACAFALAADAAGAVHIEWLRGATVYGAQTISSSGASVASSPAPDFGGVPGQARISVTSGAVIVTFGPSPTATQTNGIRLQVGSAPYVIPVNTGTKIAIIEATEPAAGFPSTGTGVGGDATAANQEAGNASLATIATNTTGLATAAAQTTGNAYLSTIATQATGAATATNQVSQIAQETAAATVLGTVSASPTANTIADRLKTLNTTLGTPLQAGAVSDASDGVATAANAVKVISRCTLFDGTVWNRCYTVTGFADGNTGAGIQAVGLVGYNGATYDHLRSDANKYLFVNVGAWGLSSSTVLGHVVNDASSAVIGHVIADSGSTTAVTGTVTVSATLQTQADTTMVGGVNVKEVNGVAPSMGNGVSGTGVQRVTIASDSTGQVTLAAGSALVGMVGNGQASTTSGQSGPLIQGAVTTSAPTYTTAQTDPLSLTTAGGLRTDMATIAGTTTSVNNGTAGTGTQRVAIASDNTPFTIKVTGNAGATIDATVAAGSAPTNGIAGLVQYNTTVPAPTAGQTVGQQADATGATYVNTEGRKASYTAAYSGATIAGDSWCINGSGTKTVRVTRIRFSGFNSTALLTQPTLFVRSAADTSGTCAAQVLVPYDSNYAAATATVKGCSVAPTPGATVGQIRLDAMFVAPSTSPTGPPQIQDITFGERNTTELVLRGSAQGVCLNTGTGWSLTIAVDWTEE